MSNKVIQSAYHEAGHAVIAKLFGFNVISISISENSSGIQVDYGFDFLTLQYLYNYKDNKENTPAFIKTEEIQTFIPPMILTLFAGQVAERYFLDPNSKSIVLGDTGLRHDDIQRIESLISFAQDKNLKYDYNSFNEYAEIAHGLVSFKSRWSVIEKLTQLILESNNQLNAHAIEDFFSKNDVKFV